MIYADNAASTPTDPRVLDRFIEVAKENFANPSSIHKLGEDSSRVLNSARKSVANFINANENEIYFFASATEALNTAIAGTAKANNKKHIITTNAEHPAVLNTCLALEKQGYEITKLDVNENGVVTAKQVSEAINSDTLLVALAYGNSELGTLCDVKAIGEVCSKNKVIFIVDACQSAAYEELDVIKFKADLLVFNGSKMYGPKGVSALYVSEKVNIFPIIYGGGQEKSLRSGTENLPAIAALATACEIAKSEQNTYKLNIKELTLNLLDKLKELPIQINALQGQKLANHVSLVLMKTSSTNLVADFSELGICVSSGSACSQKSQSQSHVLASIGLSSEEINKTVRITLGKYSQLSDIEAIIDAIKQLNK